MSRCRSFPPRSVSSAPPPLSQRFAAVGSFVSVVCRIAALPPRRLAYPQPRFSLSRSSPRPSLCHGALSVSALSLSIFVWRVATWRIHRSVSVLPDRPQSPLWPNALPRQPLFYRFNVTDDPCDIFPRSIFIIQIRSMHIFAQS